MKKLYSVKLVVGLADECKLTRKDMNNFRRVFFDKKYGTLLLNANITSFLEMLLEISYAI